MSALGASSPVDYIINSISNPDQQIKEAFVTRIVITEQGLIHQGIVIDRTGERLVLKDAKGSSSQFRSQALTKRSRENR
ncbi:MAG: hypothetical protein R3B91_10635 [Planctomycetaceae bacterium]